MVKHAAKFAQSISIKTISNSHRVKCVPVQPKLTTQPLLPPTTTPAIAPCRVNRAAKRFEEQRKGIVKNVHQVRKFHHNKRPAACAPLASTTQSPARPAKIVPTTTHFAR